MNAALTAVFAWWRAHMGKPYWRSGSPGTRFGDWGYDCSGAASCASWAGGAPKTLPSSSGDIAKWGIRTGRAYAIRNVRQAKPGDIVIYDRFGVPQDSNGSRGHEGQVDEDGKHTDESNGAHGVSQMDRGDGFWCLAIDMSDFFGSTPPPAPARKRGILDMRLIRDHRPTSVSNTGQMVFWYSGGWARQLDPQEVPYHQKMLRDAGLPDTVDDNDDSNHLIDRLKVTKRITIG